MIQLLLCQKSSSLELLSTVVVPYAHQLFHIVLHVQTIRLASLVKQDTLSTVRQKNVIVIKLIKIFKIVIIAKYHHNVLNVWIFFI